MFRIEMLPAQQGDALWIEYGTPGSVHRVLVDAGTPPTYQRLKDRIQGLPAEDRTFDLLIVTHIENVDSSVVCSLRFAAKSLSNLTRPRRRAWESDAAGV